MQRSHLLPVSQQRSQTSIELLYKKTLVAAKVRVSHYPVSLIIIHTNASSSWLRHPDAAVGGAAEAGVMQQYKTKTL